LIILWYKTASFCVFVIKRLHFMLRKNPVSSAQSDLFRQRLDQIIDMRHGLVKLSALVQWDGLYHDFLVYYCANNGRPGEPIRLMAGLLLLKELKGLSDEEVCQVWSENPYFQYFCGETFFQHRLPVEPPSLSIFRKRIGEAGMERLLQETVSLGLKTGTVTAKDIGKVSVDTTVQEKAVRFPTDSQLCHTAREALVDLVEAFSLKLRQNYRRKSKHSLFMANRYFGCRQMKRGKKMAKQLRNYLGRVIREIERLGKSHPGFATAAEDALKKARIIYAQAGDVKAKEKLYSWHAPEVECIAKGKAHKAYEFGVKVSFASTIKSNFIVGAKAFHGRPYDGHTLKKALGQVQQITAIMPHEVQVDQGYRNHGIKEESGTRVILSRQKRGVTRTIRKRQKRRNAIEPIIGHCKHDRAIGARNFLKGILGDQVNAIALAVGFNLRKILKQIFLFLCRIILLSQNLLLPKLSPAG
jgi:transposase, IS5 family